MDQDKALKRELLGSQSLGKTIPQVPSGVVSNNSTLNQSVTQPAPEQLNPTPATTTITMGLEPTMAASQTQPSQCRKLLYRSTCWNPTRVSEMQWTSVLRVYLAQVLMMHGITTTVSLEMYMTALIPFYVLIWGMVRSDRI